MLCHLDQHVEIFHFACVHAHTRTQTHTQFMHLYDSPEGCISAYLAVQLVA